MNKKDLIATFKNETRLTKLEAKAVVDLFFNEISEELSKDDRIEIRGLCPYFGKDLEKDRDVVG